MCADDVTLDKLIINEVLVPLNYLRSFTAHETEAANSALLIYRQSTVERSMKWARKELLMMGCIVFCILYSVCSDF